MSLLWRLPAACSVCSTDDTHCSVLLQGRPLAQIRALMEVMPLFTCRSGGLAAAVLLLLRLAQRRDVWQRAGREERAAAAAACVALLGAALEARGTCCAVAHMARFVLCRVGGFRAPQQAYRAPAASPMMVTCEPSPYRPQTCSFLRG